MTNGGGSGKKEVSTWWETVRRIGTDAIDANVIGYSGVVQDPSIIGAIQKLAKELPLGRA